MYIDYIDKDGFLNFAKYKIDLITGRTHQIRLFFSSCGFPILGDYRYLNNLPAHVIPQCDSIALNSCSLSFDHPETRNKIHVEYDYLKDHNILEYIYI